MELGGTRTFKNGTFMRNFAEPGARFLATAPNHPGVLLEEPQAFQAVGEQENNEGNQETRKETVENKI